MNVDPKDVLLACALPTALPADSRVSHTRWKPRGNVWLLQVTFFGNLADRSDITMSYALKFAVQSCLFLSFSEGRKI